MRNYDYNSYATGDSSEEDFGFLKFRSSRRPVWIYILILLILGGGVLFFLYTKFAPPPDDFPQNNIIFIEEGSTLKSVGLSLEEDKIVRSHLLFDVFAMLYGGDRKIISGYYGFSTPISVQEVARRVVRGDRQIPQSKITFPEGFTRKEIAETASAELKSFNTANFLSKTKDQEGYLFPDTYFFFPFSTEDEVIEKMSNLFTKKVTPLQSQIEASGHTEKEIIIMASIVEKEASGNNDREIIAGILWKRIEKGIALQVDAPFVYILGKESKDLTVKDLAIDSSYNTYKHKGLPPTPIANPGIASIKATIQPEDSDYLFYLHDSKGVVHFAKTFDEHKKNIALYLR